MPAPYRDWLNSIFLGCKGPRVLISLTCYEDESGLHDSAPVFVMAGWIAPDSEWIVFDERWRAILKNAGLGDKPYHSTDCEHGWGACKGWSVEAREALTFALVDVIRETRAIGGAIALDRKLPDNSSLGAQTMATEPYPLAVPLFLGEM